MKKKKSEKKQSVSIPLIQRLCRELCGASEIEFAKLLSQYFAETMDCENIVFAKYRDVEQTYEVLYAQKPLAMDQALRLLNECETEKDALYSEFYADKKMSAVFTVSANQKEGSGAILIIGANNPQAVTRFGLHEWASLSPIIASLLYGAEQIEKIRQMMYIDDVTQLHNQRYLNLVLDNEIQRAERASTPFSVLFMDIDHFKLVNDSSGHVIGSKLLQQVAEILKANIRKVDYGFRYGGDEFILILVGVDETGAQQVAERIRHQVETKAFEVNNIKLKLTMSIGVASFPKHAKSTEDIIRLADEAMYSGKKKSRNIVLVAG